jgi:hypothetical protein
MRDLDRRHIGRCHDHPQAHFGQVEQAFRKVKGHANAAMRRRISRQSTTVERNARPGEALHVGHEGIIVEVRVVIRVLLDDAEDPGGRLASPLATRHRRTKYPAIGVVDGDPLALQRNDRQDRLASGARFDGFDRALVAAFCGADVTAGSNQRGQNRGGKMDRS